MGKQKPAASGGYKMMKINETHLHGSQVRPAGQSSLVRVSHSRGEQTQDKARATATERTMMPPRSTNGTPLILCASFLLLFFQPLVYPVSALGAHYVVENKRNDRACTNCSVPFTWCSFRMKKSATVSLQRGRV